MESLYANGDAKYDAKRLDSRWILLITGVILMSALWYYKILPHDLWIDEVFTSNLVNNNMSTVIDLSAKDMHPPLYNIMSRLFTYIFGLSTLSLRTFSFLAYAGLVLLSLFRIREILGDKTAMAFLFLVTFTPVMYTYVLEIRMYAWANLFITICTVYAYLFIKEKRLSCLIIMCVSGIAAAYTHYYALVTVAIIYAVLLAHLIYKKYYAEIKKLAICIIASIAVYIPWVIIFLRQFDAFSSRVYIPPVKWYEFLMLPASYYIIGNFRSDTFDITYFWFSLPIVFCAAILVVGLFYRLLKDKFEFSLPFLSLAIFVLTALFFISFSIAVKPLFKYRYFMCLFGLICIFLSYSFAYLKPKIIPMIIVVVFISTSIFNIYLKGIVYDNAPVTMLCSYISELSEKTGNDIWIVCEEEDSAYPNLVYYLRDEKVSILEKLPDASAAYAEEGWIVSFTRHNAGSNTMASKDWVLETVAKSPTAYKVIEELSYYSNLWNGDLFAVRVKRIT